MVRGTAGRPVPVRAITLLAATVVTVVTLATLADVAPTEDAAAAPATVDAPEDATGSATPGATPGGTDGPATSAPGTDVAPEPDVPARLAPLQVRIGTIAVDAPVVPVGLEPDGAMEIPERVAEIGWYDPDGLGVLPGATGTAVLAGHVDSRSQGRGALYDLRDLRTGETIELDLADGSTQGWRITEVIQYPKDVIPLEEIFTWSGASRLAIITCGGEFDRTARSYTDNIVVYAEPLPDSPAA